MSSLAEVSEIAEGVVADMPAAFRPLKVDAREDVDWLGEPSLRVTLVFPKATFARDDVGRRLVDAGLLMRERLIEKGEQRFPYVAFSAG